MIGCNARQKQQDGGGNSAQFSQDFLNSLGYGGALLLAGAFGLDFEHNAARINAQDVGYV